MKITFLSADRPLTKTYVFDGGNVESTPYPLTSEFTSHVEDIGTLEDFFVALSAHSNVGHCLLKGNLRKPLIRESRAGLTVSEPTQFVVLDFDGADLGDRTLDEVLTEIGLHDVSYIQQFSASYGIKPGFNAHIFLLLDESVAAETLKLWFKWKNLSAPFLRSQLSLTKTGMALHWPLDCTVGQNDKLIYIAPPVISGRTLSVGERTTLHVRKYPRATLSAPPMDVDEQSSVIVKQLRSAAGLKEHKLNTVFLRKEQAEVLKDPDAMAITGVKQNGDFTYVNINGGDSWGYFHNTVKPEIIHNFKGEPLYRTQDIAPDYYLEAKHRARDERVDAHRPKELNGKVRRWVINRRDEGKYYKVTYIPGQGVTLDPAPTLKHVEDWCVSNGVLVPNAVEDWSVEFNPTTTDIINAKDKIINTYRPTVYKSNAVANDACPTEYIQLITHICGGDVPTAEHLLNWVAYVWQTGEKPQTAWTLHGTYGTGKGRFAKVLQELFGEQFVVTSPEAVSDQFNASIENAQILWIDEVTTDAWDNAKVTPKLRSWISDGVLPMRAMRRNMRNVRNYMGIIVAANEHNPVEVRDKDRRWNIAPRQETALLSLPWATADVLDDTFGVLYQPSNLQAFANYLESRVVDVAQARTPLVNDAKKAVMSVTQNLPEDIVQALQTGNTKFFVEYVLPAESIPTMESAMYRAVVTKMMRGGRVPLRTEEIRTIFLYLANWNQKAAKFNKAAARFGLYLSGKIVRDGSKTYAGIPIVFTVTAEDKVLWDQLSTEKTMTIVREDRESA